MYFSTFRIHFTTLFTTSIYLQCYFIIFKHNTESSEGDIPGYYNTVSKKVCVSWMVNNLLEFYESSTTLGKRLGRIITTTKQCVKRPVCYIKTKWLSVKYIIFL